MNTRQIAETTTWSPEKGNIILDTLILKDFNHYFFDGGAGMVSYSLREKESLNEYYANNISIPAEILAQWGASDDIIFNYVAQQLNLIIINY